MCEPREEGVAGARARKRASVVAAFGIEAFRTEDLDALLTKAAELAAKGLYSKRAKVLELLASGDELLIRAGVGWKPDVVGKVAVDADIGSAAGYALLTGEPVISEDVEHDKRFRYPEVLREHGIKSAVNVIIQGRNAPFGVLEVDTEEKRSFSRDDIDFLQNYANVLAAAIERHKVNLELSQATHQREVLLHELQHRVKNTLQIILSFISLERHKATDDGARDLLDRLAKRVESLGLMYRKLAFANGEERVEFGEYLEEICKALLGMPAQKPIKLDVRRLPLMLGMDQALPLGLIANEFVSNSLKHAFPNGRGTITIHLDMNDEANARLVLADDGIGALSPAKATKGSGLRLIEQLAQQAHAKVSWDRTAGTKATLMFPVLTAA